MLKLRHLRLRAISDKSTFGADIPFENGLNVLQAGNTSGKSTCMQAIMFVLGLERSLGPQLTIPLPYAMREKFQVRKNGDYQPVLQSYVELEIENTNKEIVTIRRDVVGGDNPKLVKTWNGPRITGSGAGAAQRDFYVHDAGASQREDGFHAFLTRFMGWTLPLVTKFDGSDCPLYIETIFPMLFVEQKRGWSAIQGPLPTFFGIQDLTRRVLEFLLDLDAGKVRRERAELRRDITLVERDWARVVADLERQVSQSFRFKGVPAVPTAEFAQTGSIELEIYEDGSWTNVGEATKNIQSLLSELESAEIPTAESAAPELEKEFSDLRERAAELAALMETAQRDFNVQSAENREIERRLNSLESDLAKNQDAQKLQKLGSTLGTSLTEHVCPTCHQDVSMELLPVITGAVMALDENISFLKSQIELYRSTQRSLSASLDQTRSSYGAVSSELRDVQRRIREIREALIQPSSSPSRARIEEILTLQSKLERLNSAQQTIGGTADDLLGLAKRWASLKARLKEIGDMDFSSEDNEKVRDFEATVRRHLERYGFVSFHVDEIFLSPDDFRPLARTRDNDDPELTVEKEINFELSASDAIRLKWAYYLSLMSIARRRSTNHPGIVIFDEPGQQEIDAGSFKAFLHWAADNTTNQQTIIATSQTLETVREAIGERRAHVRHFDDFILAPVE